jgi:hypothetical protein
MSPNDADLSITPRARRASSSRRWACLPPAPTTRPIATNPCEMGYVWQGSAETQNMHHEKVKLDVYRLPLTGGYLYLVEVEKPIQTNLV